ncbi:unnamed protein product [Urochloa decumbens]|uniref:Uncharacterized protein n=1 Tax=Urochloa decumbens TaxID=240449 RepID=A0ABC8V667_9POAL
MVRSSLGLLSRRLTGSSATLRRVPEILQAPPLHPAHPTAPWRPRPAVESTRTFTSPAAARRAPAGSLTLQGQQHFPIISQRFLSMERKESTFDRVIAWLYIHFGPGRQLAVVMVGGISSFVWMTIIYRRLSKRLDNPRVVGN